jgi:predicted HTH domain antitoxin
MLGTIKIEYPESLANSLRLNNKEFASEMKTAAIVKLYEIGKISSGTAAKVLDLSRLDFFELLSKYKVSVLGDFDAENLNEDILNA